MNVTSGMLSFSEPNRYLRLATNYLQSEAVTSLGGYFEESSVYLTVLGTFGPPECPHESQSCVQLYITESAPNIPINTTAVPPNDSSTSLQTSSFLKLYNVNIFHATVTNASNDFPLDRLYAEGSCAMHGYWQDIIMLCAQEYRNKDNSTSLLVGMHPASTFY
jgi:hypothetical protein